MALAPTLLQAQVRGHSHNDYEQPHPLRQALELGFASIEADVHEVNGRLLVSHDKPTAHSGTLATLYLQPLDSLIRAHGSYVRQHDTTRLLLMIDFKTEASRTYAALKQELAKFPSLMCQTRHCPVVVFISGNRPVDLVRTDSFPVALDGRPTDLEKGYEVDQMPVISDHYRNWCRWNGVGEPDAAAFQAIRELAARVHREQKLLRLWAIPDHEQAWRLLSEAGVDLINTDRLEAFRQFQMKAR
jgi:hypothetical protein